MSWQRTKLSEFLTEREGRIKFENANQLGLQRIKKIDFSGNIHLDVETDTKTDMIRVRSGDLVISGINAAKGAIAVHAEDDDVLATIHYSAYEFNPDRISVDFLKWFFKSPEFSDLLREQIPGGIKTELKPKHILPLQVKLPSLSEQIEVADRLNRIRFDQLRLEHEIAHQQSLLANLKQAILQEAISGKLTADWRAAQPEMEPASQLLHRIKAEKSRLIAGKKLRKEKPLPQINPAEIPFEIPKGWEWCRMGEAGIFQRGKSKHRPRNDPKLFENGDIPFVQTGDVARSKRNGFMIETSTGYYNEVGLAQSRLWPEGTMCITIAANIAETGFLTFPACIPDSVVAFTAGVEGKTPQFLRMFIELTRTAIEQFAPATAQKNINLEIINELMLPLPPLAEQAAIVSRVESLMATCRALEAEIEHARTHAAHLLQAVLKEAFAPAASSS